MPFRSTKTYGHDVGLSCAFRQWRADSHCNKLHGYAIAVQFIFEADNLDYRNWVVDFGSLKQVKQYLVDMFDHKTLVAQDDPDRGLFLSAKTMDVVVVPAVGCEAFARMIYDWTADWLEQVEEGRVRLVSVEVREHGANSALYVRERK